MRNLILVSSIMLAMMSFSNSTVLEDNFINENKVQKGWEILAPQVNDLPPFYCSVAVFYNGVFVQNIGGLGPTAGAACATARLNACTFIEGQGGTCPQQQ
jgi:hypothetical protein